MTGTEAVPSLSYRSSGFQMTAAETLAIRLDEL